MTFKILKELSGCDVPVGGVASVSDFPKGTDFQRLIDLEAIRPTGLLSGKVPTTDLEDTIDDLHFKLTKRDTELDSLKREIDDLKLAFAKERKVLEERALKAELEVEQVVAQVADLLEPPTEEVPIVPVPGPLPEPPIVPSVADTLDGIATTRLPGEPKKKAK